MDERQVRPRNFFGHQVVETQQYRFEGLQSGIRYWVTVTTYIKNAEGDVIWNGANKHRKVVKVWTLADKRAPHPSQPSPHDRYQCGQDMDLAPDHERPLRQPPGYLDAPKKRHMAPLSPTHHNKTTGSALGSEATRISRQCRQKNVLWAECRDSLHSSIHRTRSRHITIDLYTVSYLVLGVEADEVFKCSEKPVGAADLAGLANSESTLCSVLQQAFEAMNVPVLAFIDQVWCVSWVQGTVVALAGYGHRCGCG